MAHQDDPSSTKVSYLSPQEAAQICSVRFQTVLQLSGTGELKAAARRHVELTRG